ncbi:thiamine/thiamine pyrophosphate ABC transporter permease ThiP [Rhizobium sp. C4]|uniref:thiamine/thiamine pyrophosphate ABC transporter permease ThiP n=1 Tax=Rhizobium sp. C4 TaxID=1349800 RepID=UPI001E548A39|nr:thiamine/thiamine pyrophosphate ABC transporter permease ThiP [Rhizobium sp. C4]MCD2174774.1 thiamine/thiamine pyrophosphate ABC transporter permease ThiP [Rhizobium sp. C4]
MRPQRGMTGERMGGALALAFILGFVALALVPLLRFGSAGGLDAQIVGVLKFTLLQASLSTLLSVVFGAVVALSVARRPQLVGRVWLLRFMAAPMGLPALAAAFGVLAVWGREGVFNSVLSFFGVATKFNVYGMTGILVAHTFFNIPLAARLFTAALDRFPPTYWKLAANLGLGRVSLFRLVEGPALMAALPGVAGLIFMLCATSFTLVLTLGGGPAATTLEVAIYQALKFDFEPGRAVFLVLVQVVLTGLVLLFLAAFPTPAEERAQQGAGIRRFDGGSLVSKVWDGAVILVFLIFCGAPFVAILVDGLRADFPHLLADPLFWRALSTSAALGLSAGLLALILSWLIAVARISTASRVFAGGLDAGGSLILLTPPIVLSTGWFLWLKGGGGFAPYVLVAVINALMALPFSLRVLQPAVLSHFERTRRLSQSLGLTGFQRLRIIDAPALSRPLLMAFFFALALSLGDLGAVALFGGEGFVTLPWLIYARLGSYRTTDAAALTLILAAVCMAFAVLGTPSDRRQGEAGR